MKISRDLGFALLALLVVFPIVVWQVTGHRTQEVRKTQRSLLTYQLEQCQRAMQDRVDDALVFEDLASYYSGVVAARSVKQDVKDHALRMRNGLWARSESKQSRVFLCGPLVRHGVQIPDRVELERIPPRK